MNELIIGSGNGKAYLYNFETRKLDIIFEAENDNEYVMGLAKHKDVFVICSNYIINVLTEKDRWWNCKFQAYDFRGVQNPKYAHIKNIGGYLFLPASSSNVVNILSVSSDGIEAHGFVKIKPRNITTDFDNVTGINYYDGHFYITCTYFDGEETGIIKCDEGFNFVDIMLFGWGLYGFSIIDGHKYGVCNKTFDGKRVGGIVKDDKMVLPTSPTHNIMDISFNKDYIFVVGSATIPEKNTTISGGLVTILDYNFKIIDIQLMRGLGKFLGCLLLDNDISKDKENVIIDLSKIEFDENKVKTIEVK